MINRLILALFLCVFSCTVLAMEQPEEDETTRILQENAQAIQQFEHSQRSSEDSHNQVTSEIGAIRGNVQALHTWKNAQIGIQRSQQDTVDAHQQRITTLEDSLKQQRSTTMALQKRLLDLEYVSPEGDQQTPAPRRNYCSISTVAVPVLTVGCFFACKLLDSYIQMKMNSYSGERPS